MRLALLFLLFAVGSTVSAQLSFGGAPAGWPQPVTEGFPWTVLPELDFGLLAAQDAVTDQVKEAPWRFGVEHAVDLSLTSAGQWSFEGGEHVWRLGVDCPGGLNVSFLLDSFDLPKGAKLYVYNEEGSQFLGSFTEKNELDWGGLAIGVISGGRVVLEYHEPVPVHGLGQLSIAQIVHGYRSLLRPSEDVLPDRGPFGTSGACNINVNCPSGAAWQVEKRAVALITQGGFAVCSGALVNNVLQDGTPYFLTANHCLGTPGSWVYYFNHETTGCTGSTGPTNQSISGGTLKASRAGSDFALIQLSSTPPAAWNVQYAGWDASGTPTTSAVGIHHPSGDVKKICFENNAPYTASAGGAQVWMINQWELGVTEPGSSGSPLFDANHRIIGQLYGGASACNGSVNNGQNDYYGRFNVSWNTGTSASQRLRDWLDPTNTGTLVLNGYPTSTGVIPGCTNPAACNYAPNATEDNGSCAFNDACGVCGGDGASCTGCMDPTACNYDATATLAGDCYYAPPGGGCDCTAEIAFSPTLPGGQTASTTAELTGLLDEVTLTLAFTPNDQAWPGDLILTVTAPDGSCVAFGGYDITPACGTYGGGLPTSWNSTTAGTYTTTFLLPDGPEGSGTWTVAVTNGWSSGPAVVYAVTVELGGLCTGAIPGCTDLAACNFDPLATVDDGSCIAETPVYPDVDFDGYGSATAQPLSSCDAVAIYPLVANNLDCNDGRDDVYPGAPGTGEGIDNNCDGAVSGSELAPDTSCPADLNGSGVVDVVDLLLLLGDFGCTANCTADIDGDGITATSDMLAFLSAFSDICN